MKVKKMAAAALVLSSVMALGAVGYAAPAADSVKDIKNNGITFYGGANLVEIPLKDITRILLALFIKGRLRRMKTARSTSTPSAIPSMATP